MNPLRSKDVLVGYILPFVPLEEVATNILPLSREFSQLNKEEILTHRLRAKGNAATPEDMAGMLVWKVDKVFFDVTQVELNIASKDAPPEPTDQQVLAWVPNCKRLTVKYLPNEFLKWFKLESLEVLHWNRRVNRSLLEKQPLQSLSIFNIDGILDAAVKDEDIASLRAMPLTKLRVDQAHAISEEGIRILKQLPLKNALLGSLLGDERIYRNLGEISTLNSLDISFSAITDKGLSWLKNLRLNRLILRECEKIADNGLMALVGMPLTELDLKGYKSLKGRISLLGELPLKELGLEATDVTNGDLQVLGMMQLSKLNLRLCEKIRDRGIQELARSRTLTTLDLGRTKITGKILSLLNALPLTDLDLENCAITDGDMRGLDSQTLRKLSLLGCFDLTDQSAAHLGGLSLSSLKLFPRVSDKGLEFLGQRRPLSYLCIDLSSQLPVEGRPFGFTNTWTSEEGVSRLKSRMPGIEIDYEDPEDDGGMLFF